MKRVFDLLASVVGLLALAPVFVAIAVAVRLSMGSPVFFTQTRIGRFGRPFVLYKFRTMNAGRGEEHAFTPGDTSRVTPLGRLLRRSKLDELPQIVNVLKGEMSVVGPRPEVAKWVKVYPERWAVVHTVRPGITDPASVTYRDEEELLARALDAEEAYRRIILPHKLSLYENYIRECGVVTDLAVIARTLLALVRP